MFIKGQLGTAMRASENSEVRANISPQCLIFDSSK